MTFSTEGGTFAYGVSAPGRPAAPQRFALWDLARGRARTSLDLATPWSAQTQWHTYVPEAPYRKVCGR
jgi:hypothetical protein